MKILLVQTGFLGDTILSTPLIASAKRLYPDAEIWMLTTPQAAPLVMRDPLLSGVIQFDKRGRGAGTLGLFKTAMLLREHHFDRCYSVHRSTRTSLVLALAKIPFRVGYADAGCSWLYHKKVYRTQLLHDVLRRLEIFSHEKPFFELDTSLRLFSLPLNQVSDELRSFIEQGSPYTVLVPGSAWNTKRWTPLGFHAVAKELISRGKRVALAGAPEESALVPSVMQNLPLSNFVGRLTLAEFVTLVAHAEALVGNDSMSLHVASALKIPSVTVFCATSPRFGFGPWQNWAFVVQMKGLDCKPCRAHGSNRCPTGTDLCMTGVSPLDVLGALDQVLSWSSDAASYGVSSQ